MKGLIDTDDDLDAGEETGDDDLNGGDGGAENCWGAGTC